ncbi:thioredoxin-disulfide reductase [Agrobacterium rubi]|nr:thioredoxin-disulfide reductase [Agrobacterium rubi]NTF24143.1 thioredoxin-disulfide reductase [Agrobacterium rubi]
MEHKQLIIIGSGAAGWTAAIYAARAGLEPLVIAGLNRGGQMLIAGEVENFPGFEEAVDGPELMDQMEKQALRVGAEAEDDIVNDIDVTSRPFRITCEFSEWTADAVIIATGATARWLGVPGEEEFQGQGVSACATCDGYFFKGQTVAVVGGGNTAAEEALYLSNICETVHLIHRRNELRAERILQDRISKQKNIFFHGERVVKEVHGGGSKSSGITHLTLESTIDGGTESLEVDGLFVAIGHDPATKAFEGKIDLDSNGYIATLNGGVKTSVPGIFAAGDVADPHYRQAVTAAGFGCMAALDVQRWLAETA